MEDKDFLLDIVYKNKTVRFQVVNPDAPLETLMTNIRHAIGNDGKLIFDFPSIDQTGAPLDYLSKGLQDLLFPHAGNQGS